ncbi:MAG: acyl-CoA desaturase [Calditrichia bacterium]
MEIAIFFIAHWYLSLFSQTFFMHRYGAHQQYTLSPFMVKVFYIFSFITQGSSTLSARAYAIMHRLHHEYSDTREDPHSPHFFKNVFQMMWHTKKIYHSILVNEFRPDPRFEENVPNWEAFEKFYDKWYVRVSWGVLYTLFYIKFATAWWMFLLLPIHYLMGPVHGAIVNWAGHKYGYRNYDLPDRSRNTLPVDLFLLGELYQNNHHKEALNPNFARRWFELDPVYPVMRVLGALRLIRLKPNAPA